MDKKELRRQVRKSNLEKLTTEYRLEASFAICEKLRQLPEFCQAKRIALYHALPDEPDLTRLLAALSAEKSFFLPRVEGEDIAFYPYLGEESLDKGSFGIIEPSQAPHEVVDPVSLDLVAVPGMAFSPDGVRLGRGKAFYDRFIPHTKAFLVGITFEYRLLPSIPQDPWDCPMDTVITN